MRTAVGVVACFERAGEIALAVVCPHARVCGKDRSSTRTSDDDNLLARAQWGSVVGMHVRECFTVCALPECEGCAAVVRACECEVGAGLRRRASRLQLTGSSNRSGQGA